MVEKTYIAFEVSEPLASRVVHFLQQADMASPVDYPLLNEMINLFIDDVLQAFFLGPVEALESRGRFATLTAGLAGVVSTTSKKLARRLLGNIDEEEYYGLAQHFSTIFLSQADSNHLIGFPLSDADAATLDDVCRREWDAGAEPEELLRVLHGFSDNSLTYFLDASLAPLKLGRLTRGVVAAARVVIKKACYTLDQHTVNLPQQQRQQVISYLQTLVVKRGV